MTSWAGSESTADGQRERERRWRRQESSDSAGVGGGGGGIWLRGRWFHCDSPCCHQTDGGPWVALSIPTWEACKWRGRAVIIYSPQLLTLDSELITAEGKSDRTWRVPEPVTLISVRCLQQEVWEEELVLSALAVDLRVRVCTHLCVFQPGGGSSGGGRWGWGGGTRLSDWTMTQDDTWYARSWTKIQQEYVPLSLFILLALVLKRYLWVNLTGNQLTIILIMGL